MRRREKEVRRILQELFDSIDLEELLWRAFGPKHFVEIDLPGDPWPEDAVEALAKSIEEVEDARFLAEIGNICQTMEKMPPLKATLWLRWFLFKQRLASLWDVMKAIRRARGR